MIHPTAVIDKSAVVADDCTIGPYSIVGPDVEIGEGTWLGPHVVISGPTRIGKRNRIFQFASIGEEPQDKKFDGEPTQLEVGDDNTIREYTTMNRGTTGGGGITRVGSRNLFMASTHVAHDCQVADDTIFANGSSLAGHVEVGSHAILAGFTCIHQFCVIGEHAFVGLNSVVNRDVAPYMMVVGNYATARGINKEGLRRRGFSDDAIADLHRAYKLLIKRGDRAESLEKIKPLAASTPEVNRLLDFVQSSERGIVR
ncbi:MAG: acyl-ACP--UDP-N-acetylglucosamine O-acyltransferase [Granulosicoccus sp.]|nr:acyl-ACP--UDP-N-acetylglucosamine O-acyltransferase [Granulosicoccus sp.]